MATITKAEDISFCFLLQLYNNAMEVLNSACLSTNPLFSYFSCQKANDVEFFKNLSRKAAEEN